MKSYELSPDLIALVSLSEKKKTKTKKEETPDADTQRKGHGESFYQKPNPADILIFNFQLPDCEKIHFCCLRPQSVMFCHGSPNRLTHHSKCGLWINRTRMTWELVRNTVTGSTPDHGNQNLHFHKVSMCFEEPCPREGNGTPLRYSCLETPMDGGAW